MKVAYHELPTNVRLAIIPLWISVASLFFYSIAINLSVQKGLEPPATTWFNFGLYIGVFFLLKRKNRRSFFTALILLTLSITYMIITILKNLTYQAEPLLLSVWWPTGNTIVLTIAYLLIALPKSWRYYSITQ